MKPQRLEDAVCPDCRAGPGTLKEAGNKYFCIECLSSFGFQEICVILSNPLDPDDLATKEPKIKPRVDPKKLKSNMTTREKNLRRN